jgi:hypothetical protein
LEIQQQKWKRTERVSLQNVNIKKKEKEKRKKERKHTIAM